MNREYLPSKKFTKFIGITVLVVVILFGFSFFIKNKNNQVENISFVSASVAETDSQDTDNDGLRDWEEALWKTDPNNPDTDGDGILDGQEANLLKKETQDETGEYESSETNTALLSKQLLTIATTLQNQGNVSQADIDAVVEEFLGGVNIEFQKPYKLSDLQIDYGADRSSYFNEMRGALTDRREHGESALSIFERAIGSNSERILRQMDPIIEEYEEIPDKIIDITVPSGAAQAHLDFMNASVHMSLALKDLKQYFADPVVSMRGIIEYNEAEEEFLQAVSDLNNYFKQSGII